MEPSHALTIAGDGLLKELQSQFKVGTPIVDPDNPSGKMTNEVVGIWDTGATGSVITQSVVDALGIQPITMTMVHGVHGTEISPVYLVDFYLPSNVIMRGVNVTLGKLPGVEVLIGMDIINMGDFAVTNPAGKTKMSFRVPSQTDIDFVRDTNAQMAGVQGASRKDRRAQEKSLSRKSQNQRRK
jgi:hypothetical protein